MILDIGRGLLCMLFGLFCVICFPLVPIAVLFRQPAGVSEIEDTGEGGGKIIIRRSTLPRWLWWLQTPDERLPGGLYEPTILKWLSAYGDYWCSVRWLWRNAGYGLAWALGQPADAYLDPLKDDKGNSIDGIARRGPLWRWRKTCGPIVFQAGRKVHRRDFEATQLGGPFWAIPFVTARSKANS